MKIYKIKVNGKAYKVELEAIDEVASASPAVEAKKEAPKAAPGASGEGKPVPSPIQGQVTKILVKPGDSVKKGGVLLMIEAMKLENEVVAPSDGVVAEVLVSKGQNVSAKDPLVLLK